MFYRIQIDGEFKVYHECNCVCCNFQQMQIIPIIIDVVQDIPSGANTDELMRDMAFDKFKQDCPWGYDTSELLAELDLKNKFVFKATPLPEDQQMRLLGQPELFEDN